MLLLFNAMKSRFLLPILAIALTGAVVFGVRAFAGGSSFVEPTTGPTGANAYAPLDTSGNANTKQGGLFVGAANSTGIGLVSMYGNVGIGVEGNVPMGTLDVESTTTNPATFCLNKEMMVVMLHLDQLFMPKMQHG